MCIKSDFEEIVLKLVTYVHFVVIKTLSPMDCLPLPGAIYIIEPPHDKMACAPSEDSDQPGHPHCLIRVFAVQSMGS